MKVFKILTSLFVIVIFSAWVAIYNPGMDSFNKTKKEIIHVADPISLKSFVKEILDTKTPRNYQNEKSLNIVADRIKNIFLKFCDEVKELPFSVNSVKYKNIGCTFHPKEKKRIVLGAHYDVYGGGPGADDNASGVAGILELARLFKEKGIKNKKRIDLVAFTLEEPPFFRTTDMGSYHYAKSLKDENIDIEFMISLEMIGVYSDRPDSQKYFLPGMSLVYGNKGNFAALIGNFNDFSMTRKIRSLLNENSQIEIKSVNAPKFLYGVDWSDHLNFWKFGYPAFMITDTSFFRNGNYHKKTDTIKTLDFFYMAQLIHGIYSGISSY